MNSKMVFTYTKSHFTNKLIDNKLNFYFIINKNIII